MTETAGFNIQTLADFMPPDYLCEKCLALLLLPIGRGNKWQCPTCSVEYTSSSAIDSIDVGPYLNRRGLALKFNNILEHCRALAVASQAGDLYGGGVPLRALLETMSNAKHFVHFTSFGISDFFVGILKLLAQRIRVRGVVSNVDERIHDELTAYDGETPYMNFEVKDFLRDGHWREAPHQKLVVIDGLVAFKGSANLTLNGWRKATKGLDHVEIVTNVDEVVNLHNRLFSPVWAQFSKIGPSIRTGDSPGTPF
jgi:hypothetical protein